MAVLAICYDINKEGAAYSAANKVVTDKIKASFTNWWHHLDSTWLVVTDKSPLDVANIIWGVMDSNDELLVIPVGKAAAWGGFNARGRQWLKDNLP
jgi:hypothetical protein